MDSKETERALYAYLLDSDQLLESINDFEECRKLIQKTFADFIKSLREKGRTDHQIFYVEDRMGEEFFFLYSTNGA